MEAVLQASGDGGALLWEWSCALYRRSLLVDHHHHPIRGQRAETVQEAAHAPPAVGELLRALDEIGGAVYDDKGDDDLPLIGILLLQSPPITLSPRDRFFQYPPGQKVDKINTTADVHSLMAVPPYNDLLGGKLVAYAAASNEVREAYRRKYAGRRTEIEGRVLPADLVALTAVSAFGRSSLYNRLRYRDGPIAISLGYAAGYGVFHLEPFYPFFRALLESRGISTRGGFDAGPRVKWQICVRALEALGLSRTLINHSVPREVFLFPLAHNLKDFMEGRAEEPLYRDLPFRDLAAYWHERWLLPRAERVDRWRSWEPEGLLDQVFPTDADGASPAFPSGQG